MAKLKENTVVVGEDGQPKPLAAGTEVPKWAVKQVGDHLLDEPAKAASEPPDGSLPPKSGNGSGKAAWLAYARTEENAAALAAAEVQVADDASRDDIIAALDKAGVATEKQES